MEDRNGSAWLDPTLDACCQRDMEDRAKFGAMQRTLQRFDVVAERERRRKHLVQLSSSSSSSSSAPHAHGAVGCRCLYDPQVDGGEYPALTQLRAVLLAKQQQQQQQQQAHDGTFQSNNIINAEDEKKSTAERSRDENDEEEEDEFDYLLDDDDIPGQEGSSNGALLAWQETRMMEMEAMILKQEVEEFHGYGKHRQFHPRRIASVVGLMGGSGTPGLPHRADTTPPPPMVVLHLYDSESMASAWLDVYLEEFAAQSRGTLFVRSHGRGTLFQPDAAAPLQAQAIKDHTDLPALVLIKQGVVETACTNLRGLLIDSPEQDDKDNHYLQPDVDRDALESWLFRTGALDRRTPPAYETLCRMRPEEEALMDSTLRAVQQNKAQEAFYDCGLPGCQKAFAHEHVGITTSQQDGLVVSADTVLGKEE